MANIKTPVPNNEEERLNELRNYRVLDTIPEKEFDDLTQLASYIAGTPIALVSLVDEDRQWFKSKVGLDADQTPRNISFCQHAIMNDEIFEVNNAAAHPLFKDNPLVTGAPDIRRYHGVPLKTPRGYNIGTLCVIGPEPGRLSDEQKEALQKVADQVISQLEIRLTNQILANSREEINQFFELSLDLMCVANVDGTFRKVNNSFANFLGIPRNKIETRAFAEFIHPEDAEKTAKEVEKLAKGALTIGFKNRYLMADGSYRILKWTAAPDTNTGMIYAMARDVTDEESFNALREAELQAINNSVIRVEFSADGKILNSNSNLFDLLGYSGDEILSKSHACLLFEEDAKAKEYLQFWKELRKGNPQTGEFRRKTKDGREVFVQAAYIPVESINGEVVKVVKIASDITPLKEKQTELSKLLSTQNAILNGTDFSIISTNKDGLITLFNSGAEKLLGYKADDLIGKESPALFHDLNEVVKRASVLSEELGIPVEPGFKAFVAKTEITKQADENEWTYIHKSGNRIPVVLSVTALRDFKNEIFGYLGVAKDMSKEKMYLDQIEKKNKELDQFAYVVSHDLKAPLRAINTLSEFIEEDLGGTLDGDVAKNFKLLRRRTSQMQHLIDDILEYSKIGKTNVTSSRFCTRELLNGIIESLDYPANFQFDIADNLPVVNSKEIFFRQIFANLCSNAVKYNDKEQGVLKVRAISENNHINFIFEDNGPGIEPQYQKKVFEMFQSLNKKEHIDSTGIGLSTVKKIVQELDGEIWIESDGKKGSKFIVRLKDSLIN